MRFSSSGFGATSAQRWGGRLGLAGRVCLRALMVFALTLTSVLAPAPAVARDAPRAVNGVLDVRGWDFATDEIVRLEGEWELLWQRFAEPSANAGKSDSGSPAEAAPARALVQVPGAWNDALVDGKPLGAEGYGTYRLTVSCDTAIPLAMLLPVQNSAYRLYANGHLIGQQGTPGGTREIAQAAVVRQTARLTGMACPLNFTMHASNYDHARGGMVETPRLGTEFRILRQRERALFFDSGVVTCFLTLGLVSLLFYVMLRRDRAALWFGLFALSYALFSLFAKEHSFQHFMIDNLPWDVYLKIERGSLAVGTPLLLMFVRSLYPEWYSRRFTQVLAGTGWALALLIVLTPVRIYSVAAPLFWLVTLATGLYCMGALLHAYWRLRELTSLMVAFCCAMFLMISLELLGDNLLLRLMMALPGTLGMAVIPAVVLSRRLAQVLGQGEQRASEHSERADLLLRATNAGVIDWESRTGAVNYSIRYKEMLGYAAATDTAKWPPFFEWVHPDDREGVRAVFENRLRERSVKNGVLTHTPWEYRLRRADGEYIWVHAEAISVTGADGATLRYVASYIDITETRVQEQVLRASRDLVAAQSTQLEAQNAALRQTMREREDEQRRSALVVQAANVGMLDWDLGTRSVYYSPLFRTLLGYPAEGEFAPDYFDLVHPDDAAWFYPDVRAYVTVKGPPGEAPYVKPAEYRLRRADGGWTWIHGYGVGIRNDKGHMTRFIGAVIDVTAMRESRERLAIQAGQLEKQNEALTESVRLREEVERISRHDLKTPLNSILAVPRLLREDRQLKPDEEELLGIVERAGYRLLNMINLSLDLYKMEQGVYQLKPRAVDMTDLVRKVIADVRGQVLSKNAVIRLSAGGGVDALAAPVHAWAEELLCYSMLANLMKNAVEACPQGDTVTVEISTADEGVFIRIHNRTAVPAAVRERFFEKYATAGKSGGTGLGNYSARMMARIQGGDIALHTADPEGTAVSVRLPAVTSSHGVLPAHASEPSLRLAKVALPRMRVLAADDDEFNRIVLRRYLPSPPVDLELVDDGGPAVDAAIARRPDIILMDLQMPGMDGLEATRRIRAVERTQAERQPSIIVMFSTHDDEQARAASRAAGCDHYLAKPVEKEVLQRTLVELLIAAGVQVDPADSAAGSPAGTALLQARGADGAEEARKPAPGAALQLVDAATKIDMDRDLIATLPGFLASRRSALDELGMALDQGDIPHAMRLAHKLAGSFGLYGFVWAAGQCRSIERALTGGATAHGSASSVALAELSTATRNLRHHLDTVEIRPADIAESAGS